MKKSNFTIYWDYYLSFAICVLIGLVANRFFTQPLAQFDFQAFETWRYASQIHRIPYADIFYPYGLLEYWSLNIKNILFVKLTLMGFIGFSAYFIMRECMRSKATSLIIYSFFVTFSFFLAGPDSFGRYGILMAFCGCLGFLVTRKLLSKKYLYVLGIFASLIFSLVNDQGIYCYIITCLGIVFFVPGVFNKSRQFLFFATGALVGLIPLSAFLLYSNSFSDFVSYLAYLPTINQFAKTPFFPSAKSFANIFTFFVLLTTSGYLGLVLKRPFLKAAKADVYIALLFVALVVLEYKNTVRSIDWQITFYAFLLLVLVFQRILEKSFSSEVFKKYSFLSILIIAAIPLAVGVSTGRGKASVHYVDNKKYVRQQVLKELQTVNGTRSLLFSYPGDPIFYFEAKQVPPFYLSLYEATPKVAQEKQIEYIDRLHVEFVVVDLENFSIQDQVPNYIRGKYLTKYIFTNFTPYKKIGNYLLLKKGENDLFRLTDLMGQKYKNYLTQVNLENLVNYFPDEAQRKSIVSVASLNALIKNEGSMTLNSSNIIVFNSALNGRRLKLVTKEGYKTTIALDKCKKNSCFIDLSFVPLFYSERSIVESTVN